MIGLFLLPSLEGTELTRQTIRRAHVHIHPHPLTEHPPTSQANAQPPFLEVVWGQHRRSLGSATSDGSAGAGSANGDGAAAGKHAGGAGGAGGGGGLTTEEEEDDDMDMDDLFQGCVAACALCLFVCGCA